MSSTYPGTLDTLPTSRNPTDLVGPDVLVADDAINKIEAELGVNPSGSFSTVVARLDAGPEIYPIGVDYTGGTDSSSVIQTAINAADSAGGGTVRLKAGTVRLDSTLVMKANVCLRGAGGFNATTLERTSGHDQPLIDIIGQIPTTGQGTSPNRMWGSQLRDLRFTTNNTGTTPVLRLYYITKCYFETLFFNACTGCIAIDGGAQVMDSYFHNLFLQDCGGTDGTKPAIYIQSRIEGATSGNLGFSEDNSNNTWWTDLHIETCRDGGIWFRGYDTGTGAVNKHHIVNCKIESSKARGPFVSITDGVYNTITGLNMTISGFDTGYSTAIDLCKVIGCNGTLITNAYAEMGASLARTSFSFNSGATPSVLRNAVFNCANGKPSVANIEFVDGASSHVKVENPMYVWNGQNATTFSGAPGGTELISSYVPHKSGTVSDADFVPPGSTTVNLGPLAGTMMYDETNGRLYVKKSDGTWHYATLT